MSALHVLPEVLGEAVELLEGREEALLERARLLGRELQRLGEPLHAEPVDD